MSDDVEVIRFAFTVAPLASAMMRHADGGARLKIDIAQTDIAAINRLMDLQADTTEEAVEERPPLRVVGWRERR